MSATKVRDGIKVIDYTPNAAKAAGAVVIQGSLVGVVPVAIAANEKGALCLDGEWKLGKGSATFAVGDPVYYNAGSDHATSTNTDTFFGYATVAAVTGDATVQTTLDQVT